MTVEITPEDEKLIAEKLRSGAFLTVEDLIHRALLALPPSEPIPREYGDELSVCRRGTRLGEKKRFGLEERH